jgi:alpha-amylase/alpha-mannosidase (GH57 family)
MKDAFVAIHGHFYQPPRENPWLEAIEREESASPFHDWNERIAFECYRPNAYARIVDGQGKILNLFNNYAYLNFNFGPTLLSWIERQRPYIYRRILDADRHSLKRLGHGNAIAQVYDHIIMPLANERDRETEIRWGLADFQKRFKRQPEAIWLPETAANYPTLQLLVQHGMRYLILSPYQALRVRSLGGKRWTDVSQGKIDTTQPYRCFLKEWPGKKGMEKYIDIFFYDGIISKEIAFGDLLKDGDRFCRRLAETYQSSKKRPQLIHISTDGETYGHHKKFGEMALAFALSQGISRHGFEIVNYGAFLKKYPPVYEVEIDEGPLGEGSAWSCSHGVGRWKEDCGCHTGGEPGWNQRWRKPLREALNLLRDDLAKLFESEGENIFAHPWEARNGYIDVMMDRSPETISKFFERYGREDVGEKERIKGLKLLEMERHSLRMFTSCGWFFADLTGLETFLILEHAARAIHLAEEFSGQEIEKRFLEALSQAKSNRPEMGDGLQVFQRLVKAKQVRHEQVVNHHLLSSLFDDERKRRIFSFRVETVRQERMERDDQLFLLGKAKVVSDIIPEPKEFLFGLVSTKGSFTRSRISEVSGPLDFHTFMQRGIDGFEKGKEKLEEVLAPILGARILTIRDALREGKRDIFQKFLQKEIGDLSKIYDEIYNKAKALIEIITTEGMEIPDNLRSVSEITLSHQLLHEVKKLKTDFGSVLEEGRIDLIIEEAVQFRLRLNKEESLSVLNGLLRERTESLWRRKYPDLSGQERNIQEIIALLDSAKKWGFDLDLWEAQDLMEELLDESLKNLEESSWGYGVPKPFSNHLIPLAQRLNFNVEKISKATGFKKK